METAFCKVCLELKLPKGGFSVPTSSRFCSLEWMMGVFILVLFVSSTLSFLLPGLQVWENARQQFPLESKEVRTAGELLELFDRLYQEKVSSSCLSSNLHISSA